MEEAIAALSTFSLEVKMLITLLPFVVGLAFASSISGINWSFLFFFFDLVKDDQPEIQGPAAWVSAEAGATVSPIGMSMRVDTWRVMRCGWR